MYYYVLAIIWSFCAFLGAMDCGVHCLHDNTNGAHSLESVSNGKIREGLPHVELLSHVIDKIEIAEKSEKIDLLRIALQKVTSEFRLQPCIKALQALANADDKWRVWLSGGGLETVVELLAKDCYQSQRATYKLKICYALRSKAATEWAKNYLDSNPKIKGQIEDEEFPHLLLTDFVPFMHFLQEIGLSFSTKTSKGYTWLSAALANEVPKIAWYLFNNRESLGISLTATDFEGRSILEHATICEQFALADAIRAALEEPGTNK